VVARKVERKMPPFVICARVYVQFLQTVSSTKPFSPTPTSHAAKYILEYRLEERKPLKKKIAHPWRTSPIRRAQHRVPSQLRLRFRLGATPGRPPCVSQYFSNTPSHRSGSPPVPTYCILSPCLPIRRDISILPVDPHLGDDPIDGHDLVRTGSRPASDVP
jgi:hypothetical protein